MTLICGVQLLQSDEKNGKPQVKTFELVNYQSNVVIKNSKILTMELDKILAIVLSRDKAVFFQSKISTNHLRYMMTIY